MAREAAHIIIEQVNNSWKGFVKISQAAPRMVLSTIDNSKTSWEMIRRGGYTYNITFLAQNTSTKIYVKNIWRNFTAKLLVLEQIFIDTH